MITPEQMFDELLNEFEYIFADDLIDRKRLLAALDRKCKRLEAFVLQEMSDKTSPYEASGWGEENSPF